jgi:hypothetical protein
VKELWGLVENKWGCNKKLYFQNSTDVKSLKFLEMKEK